MNLSSLVRAGRGVGLFVGDWVWLFVGDCRKDIAAREGVRDEDAQLHTISARDVLTSVGLLVGDSVGASVWLFVGD